MRSVGADYGIEPGKVHMPEKPFVLSVKVVIRDAEGRCLVIRRSQASKYNAGKWDFPGGKVDAGESFDEALLREVEEEVGLRIRLTRVAGSTESEMPDRKVAYLIMEGQVVAGQSRLSEEHDRLDWCAIEELLDVGLCQQFLAFAGSYARQVGG